MKTLAFLLLVLTGHVGAATIAAVSSSYVDVNSAVTAAARGDTVTVPAGPSNWGGNVLVISKGLWLKGPGRDSITITGNPPGASGAGLISIVPDATAITNEETIRVTGFTFDGVSIPGGTSNGAFYVHGAGPGGTKAFKNLAIGDNRFYRFKNSSVVIYSTGQVRGCIYNNIYLNCNILLHPQGNNDLGEWSSGHWPFAYGNNDNLFFEDNSASWNVPGDIFYSAPGYTEGGQGGRCVIRYNTWDLTNALNYNNGQGFATIIEIFDMHGFQNWRSNNGGNGQTGQMIEEVYGNTILNSQCNNLMPYRGSWAMVHNNIVSGTGLNELHAQQYGDDTLANMTAYGGSGCTDAIPSAIGVYTAEINNGYFFNNTKNGNQLNLTYAGLGDGCHIAENVNYYNFNASFTGATGIGRGTSAPVMSATNGVGYWVNATATTSVNPTVVQAGHFYKRISGSWVDYYHPYTYPHPLRDTGTPVPTPTPSSTPPAPLLFIQLFPDV